MGYVAKLFAESSRLYLLAKDAGTRGERYFFLLVDSAKERAFHSALEGKIDGNIEDFGRVVASGWGKPSAETKSKMAEKYNIQYAA